jgi:hypothetical protein
MKAIKKAVPTAVSVAVQSFADEIMLRVNKIEADQTELDTSRKGVMESLAAAYGVQAIMRAKQGGISGNAMRTDDSVKAEASRLGMTPGAARELYGIIKAINAVRNNVWDDYQTAYFGEPEKKNAAPKDEPENVKALKAEKADHEQNARICKAAAKMADARAMLADTDEEKEREKNNAKVFRDDAKYYEEAVKQRAADIKAIAEENAGIDAYGTLHAAIKALHDKYATHKDDETARLAKALLTLL